AEDSISSRAESGDAISSRTESGDARAGVAAPRGAIAGCAAAGDTGPRAALADDAEIACRSEIQGFAEYADLTHAGDPCAPSVAVAEPKTPVLMAVPNTPKSPGTGVLSPKLAVPNTPMPPGAARPTIPSPLDVPFHPIRAGSKPSRIGCSTVRSPLPKSAD